MEDAHKLVLPKTSLTQSPRHLPEGTSLAGPEDPNLSFFGVFDGHAGREAAEYVRLNLYDNLVAHPLVEKDPEKALTESFRTTEQGFLELAHQRNWMDGTTAAVAVLVQNRLIVGTVGDSEIVLCRDKTALPLCKIHSLKKSEDEVERVTNAGGRIWKQRLGHPKYNPALISLGVSRAMGDLMFKHADYTGGKPSGLVADADTRVVELHTSDHFLIIGCDGLWDVMNHQQAVDSAAEHLASTNDPQAVSQMLVEQASRLGSTDNITVLVVVLDQQ